MLHPLSSQRIFAAQVDVALTGAGYEPADREAFEHGEGIALHENAILECSGLGFVGIADHVVPAAALLLQPGSLKEKRLPFRSRGERRAAPAQQPRSEHLTQRILRTQLKSFAQTSISAESLIGLKGWSATLFNAMKKSEMTGLARLGALGHTDLHVHHVRLVGQAVADRIVDQSLHTSRRRRRQHPLPGSFSG